LDQREQLISEFVCEGRIDHCEVELVGGGKFYEGLCVLLSDNEALSGETVLEAKRPRVREVRVDDSPVTAPIEIDPPFGLLSDDSSE
jgi:hypothetical protein